ncbi:MAG: ABC transporter permease [Candidatus Latescibacterota bacterium]|nr:MAG: ABC transporter permease [Candidatus Latescibacterota bacterium]
MKALYVIKREYYESIRKKSFIISTILAPVLLLVIYAIPILTVFFVPGEQVSVAVLDRTGLIADDFVSSLTDTLKDGRPKYKTALPQPVSGDFDQLEAALIETIDNGALDVLIQIPEDVFESGKVDYISKDHFVEQVMDDMRGRINPVIISHRLAGEGMDYERVSRLTQRIELNEKKLTKGGVLENEELIGEFVLVVVFVMILYMTLLSWGMSVQRSIIEEKGSRVIEVMLSSVEPRDLFLGKIIGLGSLGLTQIAIWSLMMLAVTFSSSIAAAQYASYVRISPVEIIYFIVFFILGYLLYSSIFSIIGAVCTTEQDAQQLQSIVVFPMIIPIMLMFLVIQNPNSTLAVVLSLVPLFTPMLMLARVVISDPNSWQVGLSIVLLVVSIYGVILFSARVFRVGILMYGKRPGLKEIFRWFRYA